MGLPMIHVDYDEPDPSTYRGVRLSIGNGAELSLHGTSPARDYAAISTVALVISRKVLFVPFVMCSSDVDHFVMDGGILNDED
jgi:hypothetical protein